VGAQTVARDERLRGRHAVRPVVALVHLVMVMVVVMVVVMVRVRARVRVGSWTEIGQR
jgi:hypothetical protein